MGARGLVPSYAVFVWARGALTGPCWRVFGPGREGVLPEPQRPKSPASPIKLRQVGFRRVVALKKRRRFSYSTQEENRVNVFLVPAR
jgi:hypothetical protein